MEDILGLARYAMPILAAIILALCVKALLRRRPQSLGEVFVINNKTGETYPLTSRETSLGLHKNCDIVLEYKNVANEHAVIICGKDGWYIRRVQASSHVFVNGKEIETLSLLQNGDNFTLGMVTLTFRNNTGGNFNGR